MTSCRIPGWLRGQVRDGVAGVAAQGITAATSLLVQLVAAVSLGLSQYGVFAVLLAMLVGANALYIGFVCDSFTVFDRHEPRYRAALVSAALLVAALCVSGALLLALTFSGGGISLAVPYALLVGSKLAAETVRRLFVVRVSFRALLLNDVCSLVVTALALPVLLGASGEPTPEVLLGSMCCGALAAVSLGLWQLPRSEWRGLRPGITELPGLARFAVWRALQSGLRPLTLLAARLLVAGLISTAAVGVLELARLVVAPVQVVINGSGSLLLGKLAARERGGDRRDPRLIGRAAGALCGGTVVTGLLSAVLALLLAPPLFGRSVDAGAVFGWVAYLALWAAGLPYATELVTRRMSRAVFLPRLLDSVMGLAVATTVLSLDAPVAALPWALALGGGYAAYRLRTLVRSEPSPLAAEPGTSRAL
ncbi:Membrane protein involved in the export of O-antigen and teichoic acid [Actinopolyspora lacussalsi subsp. righensis]|uniref:Membrane protein involved in the export of O-antigen and teichoic acid n=1 Tax=Actinopolyspora righensis TaxID=995060 RepID=A0A1I6ZZ14_9ACTN|nr:Membrane protein involved in the export of O-antigen and teichoic acid [Actinopolyspora righensis]